MAKILITSFEQIAAEGSAAFDRAVEVEIDSSTRFEPDAPIAPVVMQFLGANVDHLRQFNAEGHRKGAGMIYIQDRLDAPAVSTTTDDWIKPYAFNVFGGYVAVYLPLQILRGLPNERATADVVAQWSSATNALVHCRVAHEADPARLDRPYLCVVKEQEEESAKPVQRGKAR